MSAQEQWRPVVGWQGIYEISDLGRVRRIAAGRGNRGVGRVLRGRPLRGGYLRVRLGREMAAHYGVSKTRIGQILARRR